MATTQASPSDPNIVSLTGTSIAKRRAARPPAARQPGRLPGRAPAPPEAALRQPGRPVQTQPAGPSRPGAAAVPAGPAAARPSLASIIEAQEEIFIRRQPESARLARAATSTLAGGVVSSWQISRPQRVSLAGHGHPAIVEAVQAQVARGTHFAQPTEAALTAAAELSRRFGLPQWRFANSGTEATMDAVHLMRAITGRDLIIKVEGCYHGHHDSVQVSICPDGDEDDRGPASEPRGVPASAGIPRAITDLTLVVSFNDLAAVRRVLEQNPGQIAGMILEPIMMNAGIIKPEPGYLDGLKELLHAHGALLTFDEVKTGLTAGPGGATRYTGVTPDLVCLAKAIGGGVAVAAIGGTAEVMGHVANGDYEQVGTFNGNPLAMAACRAMLQEVATPDAYARLELLRLRAVAGLEREIERNGLNAQVVSVGAKGCVVFSAQPVRNFRDFLRIRDSFSHAHWLFQHNGGVFLPPWGKIEQWLISVQHDEADIDRFIDNFAAFAAAVRR